MSKMKNTLNEINGRLDIVEGTIRGFNGTAIENIPTKTQRKKWLKKNEKGISELWDNLKQPYIYI